MQSPVTNPTINRPPVRTNGNGVRQPIPNTNGTGLVGQPKNALEHVRESNVSHINSFLDAGEGSLVSSPNPGTDRVYTYFPAGSERLLPEFNQMASQPGAFVMRHPLLDRQKESLQGYLERHGGSEVSEAARVNRLSERAQEFAPRVRENGVEYQAKVGQPQNGDINAERRRLNAESRNFNYEARQNGTDQRSVTYDQTFTFGDEQVNLPVQLEAPASAILRQVENGDITDANLTSSGLSRDGLREQADADRFQQNAERAQEFAPSITVGDQTYQGKVHSGVSNSEEAETSYKQRVGENFQANRQANQDGSGQYQLTYNKDFNFGDDSVSLPVDFQGPPEALTALKNSGEISENDLQANGLSSSGLEARQRAQQDWEKFEEVHPDAGDDIRRILTGEGLEGDELNSTAQRLLDKAEKTGTPPVEAARRWADGRFEIPPPNGPGDNKTAVAGSPDDDPHPSANPMLQSLQSKLTPAQKTKLDTFLDKYMDADPSKATNDTERAELEKMQTELQQERGEVEQMLADVAGQPNIQGVGDWVDFLLDPKEGTDPAAVRATLRDDVSELRVAKGLAQTNPNLMVQVGNDANAVLDANGNPRASFDLITTDSNGARTNIDVYTPASDRVTNQHFTEAINHAAGKVLDKPSIPEADRTKGKVEAAVAVNWPPPSPGPNKPQTQPNGDQVVQTPGGEKTVGNFFDKYMQKSLNGKGRPAGADKVDALTVYDRSGRPVYRFERDPSKPPKSQWSGKSLIP